MLESQRRKVKEYLSNSGSQRTPTVKDRFSESGQNFLALPPTPILTNSAPSSDTLLENSTKFTQSSSAPELPENDFFQPKPKVSPFLKAC